MSRKKDIIKDLNYLCSKDCKISEETTKKILESISWEWTENRDGDGNYTVKGNGYFGVTYWSEKALEAVYEDLSNFKRKKGLKIRSVVTHEHVIPKSLFVNYVMEQIKKNRSIEFDKDSIDKMLVGCIVTKAEAKALGCKNFANLESKMPDNIKFPVEEEKDIWARYKTVNALIKEEKCENCNKKCDKYESTSTLEKIKVYKITWESQNNKLAILEKKDINLICNNED